MKGKHHERNGWDTGHNDLHSCEEICAVFPEKAGGLVLLILVGKYAGIGGVIGMLIATVIIPVTD